MRDVARAGACNIIYRPSDLADGTVSVNLTEVELLQGLNSILGMNGLELLERTPGSGVFSVSAKISYEGMTDLLFHAPGSVSSTNHINLKLADATLKQLLLEIAREGKVNIRYPSELADTGKFTVGLEDVDCETLLSQLLTICDLSVYRSPRLNAYVISRGFPAPSPPVYTSSPSSSDSGVSDAVGFGVIAAIVSWFILLHLLRVLLRRDLAGVTEDAKWGRARVKAFWGTLFTLSVIYSFTLGTCILWSSGDVEFEDTGLGLAFVVGSVASCVVFGFVALTVWLCRRYGWSPSGCRRTVAWCVVLLPLLVILLDSPPIWHDYAWTDLPSPKKDAVESGRLFQQLLLTNAVSLRENAPHLGSPEITTNTVAYAAEIEGAWKDIAECRATIKKLSVFDAIDETIEMRMLDMDGPAFSFVRFRDVAQVYSAYALLKSEEGDPAEGARQLAELHAVVRKALPYSKTLLRKMILIAVARMDVETAYRIMESPRCTPDVLSGLRDAFMALRHEEVSLRWNFLAEYLSMKHRCKNKITNAKFIDSFRLFKMGEIVGGGGGKPGTTTHWEPKKPELSGFWMRNISRIVAFMFFKRNSTVRDLRGYYDLLIAGADKSPPDADAASDYCERYFRRPRPTNLGGWFLVAMATPSFYRAQETVSKNKVLSDLLAVTLDHRLGGELELPDYYTGGKYLFDETTGAFSSAGPDGKPGTKDDVVLGQWP